MAARIDHPLPRDPAAMDRKMRERAANIARDLRREGYRPPHAATILIAAACAIHRISVPSVPDAEFAEGLRNAVLGMLSTWPREP